MVHHVKLALDYESETNQTVEFAGALVSQVHRLFTNRINNDDGAPAGCGLDEEDDDETA